MKRMQRMFVLTCWLLLNLPILLSAGQALTVDGSRILSTISVLASDSYLGRKPNTPEFFRLQDWIVGQYETWGLEPAGEEGTFFQTVPVSREYAVTYGMPRLVIDGREFFSRYGDFTTDPRSITGKTVKGSILFLGTGISAPEKGLDEYAGIDLKGKIVLVLKGDPNAFTPPRDRLSRSEGARPGGVFADDELEEESKDETKIKTAYEKGAAGILIYNPEKETRRFPNLRGDVQAPSFERDFVVMTIGEPVFQWILWTDPQMSSGGFSAWLNRIRTDIQEKKTHSFDTRRKASGLGFEKTLVKGEKFKDSQCRNVLAKITGSDPVLKDQYVVIGAHLDHLGVTNGQVYNGAEDNASGSAVVIEAARLMKELSVQTKRTVIFCLWTAEELGLIGSRHWVRTPADGVSMDRVVAYFNMDMVGLGDRIEAPGALNFPSIWDVIRRDQDEDVIAAVKPSAAGAGSSDYAPFIELGIESLGLITEGAGHPDFHDTGDDTHKLNPGILDKTCRFILQGAVNLANETGTELLIADRQSIYRAQQWAVTVINPDLGIRGGWSRLDAEDVNGFVRLMTEKIAELKQPREETDPLQAMRRRFGRSASTVGIRGAAVFNHDLHLLQIAREVLDFGRIDIGEDGIWFDRGLTPRGEEALGTMEKANMILHLMNPSAATVASVLAKAEKSFLISGFADLNQEMIRKINEKKVLICVDFDPKDVEGCVSMLESYKAKFGDTNNLLLHVLSEEGLEEAKKSLYFALLANGWKGDEIYAVGGAGATRRSRGNLDALPGAAPQFPPMGM